MDTDYNLTELPLWSKVIPEVEDYIGADSSMAGFTLNKPSGSDRFISWKIKKDFGINVEPWDVIATKRYMLNMGFLKECGMWGRDMTFAVKKEFQY